MGAEKPYKVLTESVKEIKYEHFITMNSRNMGNINPVVFSMLQSTTPGVFGHVELGELDNEGARAALAASRSDAPGRLPLKTSDSGTTARFTMTRLVAAHPILRVPRGRIRKFPVKLDDSGQFLVINLKDTTVEVVTSGPPAAAKPPKADSAPGAQAEAESDHEDEE